MLKKLVAVTSILAVAAVASADISAAWVPYFEGNLPAAPNSYVYSFDLQVTITGADAWTVAGGPTVGQPWITLTSPDGGTFLQDPIFNFNPPDPALFIPYPNLEYDSFYTTHLGYPNIPAGAGVSPGFAVGPTNNPDNLIADWFWTPDGNDYPGTFTIARFTVQAPAGISGSDNYADINMLVGSREVVPPIAYTARVPIPEPASLALLALGGLALIRRR